MLDAVERAALVISRNSPLRCMATPGPGTWSTSANTDIGTLREEISIQLTGNRLIAISTLDISRRAESD